MDDAKPLAPAPWATGGEPAEVAEQPPVQEAAQAPVQDSQKDGGEPAPTAGGVLSAVEAAAEHAVADVVKVAEEVGEMVIVTIPKAFKLRIDHFREFSYAAGIQKMLKDHAEHWYAKANGVAIFDPDKKQ